MQPPHDFIHSKNKYKFNGVNTVFFNYNMRIYD
jgi:hypothetical protein